MPACTIILIHGHQDTNLSRVSFRYILLLLVLFAIPGLVMIVAYGLISRELYRGIHFEMGHKKDSTGEAMYTTCGKQEDNSWVNWLIGSHCE